MDIQWFYESDGRAVGPVDADNIRRLIEQGLVSSDSLVWNKALGGWEKAENHFEELEPQPSPPPLPVRSTSPRPKMGSPSKMAGNHISAQVVALGDTNVSDGGSISRDPASAELEPAATVRSPVADDLSEIRARIERENRLLSRQHTTPPNLGAAEAISVCLSKYAVFSGRASRAEFWYFMVFLWLVGLVAGLVLPPLFQILLALASIVPQYSALVRRLHDVNLSGLWAFLPLVPLGIFLGSLQSRNLSDAFFGLLAFSTLLALVPYVMALFKGTNGPNRFG